jgi:nucleolar GTP-binding protein
MNFQNLNKIEKADFYLDIAFGRAKKRAEQSKETSKKDRFSAQKESEFIRIDTISDYLKAQMMKILKSYPSIDSLPDFYQELIKLTLDYRRLKKALASLNWAQKKIADMSKQAKSTVRRVHDQRMFQPKRNEFYGRISSVIKQISKNLEYLEEARKIMKRYPAIKTSLRTVALCGYPNVGKSSLLKSLTGASPEVNVYPFTTKTINLGYMKARLQDKEIKIQLIDVPGLFSRSKLNDIEMLSYLVLKHVANSALFLLDCSEQRSYEISDQLKLLRKIKKEFGIPVQVLVSKSDITRPKDLTDEIKKLKPFQVSAEKNENIDSVKAMIMQAAAEQKKTA